MQPTYLVLGMMPSDATPESHIAAGEWCFLGRDDTFPDWMERFTIVDERLTAKEDDQYSRRLLAWGMHHVHAYAEKQNQELAAPLSPYVWELLLGRWCTTIIPFLGLAYIVAQQAIERYGHCNLTVYTVNDALPEWPNVATLFYDLCSADGFHTLLGRVVEKMAPSTWQLIPQPLPKSASKKFPPNDKFLTSCVKWAGRKIHRQHDGPGMRTILKETKCRLYESLPDLPVPTIPFTSFWQRIFLSIVLLTNRKKKTREHPLLCEQYPGNGTEFPAWLADILWSYLPSGFRNLHQQISPKKSLYHSWVMGNRYCNGLENIKYYARLAAGGMRLFTVQHAPSYGVFPSCVIAAAEEYNHSGMITWGDVPQALCSYKAPAVFYNKLWNSHHEEKKEIYYVLDNQRPLSLVNALSLWKSIRENYAHINRFYNSLPNFLKNALTLRHYINGMGSFDSRQWPLAKKIPSAEGNNIANMQKTRVLVVDYLASSLGQALIMNVPCLWIYSPLEYRYPQPTKELFLQLELTGILHKTPESAARFLAEHWESIPEWWCSAEVQKARATVAQLELGAPSAHPILDWARTLRAL